MESNNQSFLLIDSDDNHRVNLQSYLAEAGFQVYQAKNGEQGLALLELHEPDVVICDLSTPSIDSASLLKVTQAAATDIQVIVMSSDGGMNEVVAALRFGASDYLLKPVDQEMLGYAVGRCLAQVQLRLENARYSEELEQLNRDLQRNLKVLEQDQLAGREVQLKMLPRPTQIGEYHFTHRIVPSSYLSGDFVDYFTVGDQHAVFFIADVSGHGASSAFVTVLLKNMFARKRSDFTHRSDNTILSPLGMLDVANRNLLNTEIGKHATLCVGVIDLSSHTLNYSVAGHLPLPILEHNGQAEYLPGEGMPVGLFTTAQYTENTLLLPENFVLTLFTDGILEVVPAKGVLAQEQFLLSRLQSRLESVDSVIAALELETVKSAPDDIAVLMISRRGID
ncbi:PP2C family protein-serine/threonine phosphatase [Oceanicoccus sp. KOV_DT_Chl]|uniref:PP2C family protein-serine/threonine phosphatase n=1 Tax=Oceanicoccus sp. KOV_DT_Chl TaxID=1904639 RepID=UPI000C7CBB93|nr:SpoIIE family protein phosphatase [Oceanicoccus sp. KOV_DT_Chl]